MEWLGAVGLLLALGVTQAPVLYVTGAAFFIHKTSKRWSFPVFMTFVFGWVFRSWQRLAPPWHHQFETR